MKGERHSQKIRKNQSQSSQGSCQKQQAGSRADHLPEKVGGRKFNDSCVFIVKGLSFCQKDKMQLLGAESTENEGETNSSELVGSSENGKCERFRKFVSNECPE